MTALPMPTPARRPAPAMPPRSAWFGGSMPAARLGVIVNLLVPLALLIWDAAHHMLGVDAVNFAIHTTGLVAVTYLVLSLVITPLRAITGFSWLTQFRRAIGVYAFYYAAAHLAIYFWWDRARNLHSTVYEITHRWYLMVGFLSLTLMFPLWVTSFDAAIRWMGGRKWKLLHRLAYVAAWFACYHFELQSKADKRRPNVYFYVLGGLLLWRLVAALVNRVRAPSKTAAVPAKTAALAAAAAGSKARFWKGELKVVGMFKETPSVRTFRLAPTGGGSIPFTFQAGQFLSLAVQIDGQRVTRSYTIASPPTRDAYIELTIKREDNGHVSRFLHDMLMHGQPVAVSAPAGRFTFDPATAHAVTLIAGGVGITPVMSILRDLTDRGWPGKIDLVFSVRTPADIIFADELRYLSGRHANLHVHFTATRELPPDWPGSRGRISAMLLKQLILDLVDRPAFICGPDAMAKSARDALILAGVPAERITLESFTPAATVAKDGPAMPADEMSAAATATVTFARSDCTAMLTAKMSVLEAAESVGVAIDYECRSGICGQCRSKLLSGHVTMDVRDALSDADERDGFILACQAHATEDVTIDA